MVIVKFRFQGTSVLKILMLKISVCLRLFIASFSVYLIDRIIKKNFNQMCILVEHKGTRNYFETV